MHRLKRQYGFDQKALDLKVGGGMRVEGERGWVVLGEKGLSLKLILSQEPPTHFHFYSRECPLCEKSEDFAAGTICPDIVCVFFLS